MEAGAKGHGWSMAGTRVEVERGREEPKRCARFGEVVVGSGVVASPYDRTRMEATSKDAMAPVAQQLKAVRPAEGENPNLRFVAASSPDSRSR